MATRYKIATETYADGKIAKTPNVTAISDTGIADGEIAVFSLTNKNISTSDKTIVTTLGADDTTVPTSKAVKDVTDARVVANAAIVGATKTKVTYDTKGLITSGADATTADIADSSNKRYVTDANLTVIGNTSGTNTGDVTLASPNHGLGLSNQVITMGTPSSCTNATTNAVTTTTHTHAITGFLTSLSGAVLTDQTSGQTIGDTTNRLTKLWATDITCTNAITGSVTGNAGTVSNATLTTALTVNTGKLTLTANNANNSVLTVGAGAVSVSGTNTGDNAVNTSSMTITADPGSDHMVSGLTTTFTAHENVAFGDICYINADGEAQLIDADAIATMNAIIMATATINANNSGTFLLLGIARDASWNWTVGGIIYGTVTGTSGNTLSQTAPSATTDVVQVMGIATNATRIYFNPQLTQVEIL